MGSVLDWMSRVGGGLAEGNDRRVTNEQFPLSQISRDIYFGIDFRPV